MISVWVADLDAAGVIPRSQLDLLDASEEERSKFIRNPEDRRRYLLGRILLRRALSETIGGEPRSWKFIIGQTGKVSLAHHPELSSLHPFVDFNISHSDGALVVAISTSARVGVDVELLDEARMVHPVEGVFSKEEAAYLERLQPARKARESLRLWTRKEAFAKLVGQGLQMDFSQVNLLEDRPDTQIQSQELRLSGKSYILSIAGRPLRTKPVLSSSPSLQVCVSQ